MEELPPTPRLDFVLLFSRNKQRASRAANRGSECEESALQTRMGTCTLLPITSRPLPEPHCTQLRQGETCIRKTKPGLPGLRVLWGHFDGTFCLLTRPATCLQCLHIRHMPSHPPTHRLTQLPAPRGAGTAPCPHHNPQRGAPQEGDIHQEEGVPLPHSSSWGVEKRMEELPSSSSSFHSLVSKGNAAYAMSDASLPPPPTSGSAGCSEPPPSGDDASKTSDPWRGDPRGLSCWPPAPLSSLGGWPVAPSALQVPPREGCRVP